MNINTRCILLLIGIPCSGKTKLSQSIRSVSFCEKLSDLLPKFKSLTIWTITYDLFPEINESKTYSNNQYKEVRRNIFNLTSKVVQETPSELSHVAINKFVYLKNQNLSSKQPKRIKVEIQTESHNEEKQNEKIDNEKKPNNKNYHLFIVDDNMQLKSMRKQYARLCVDNGYSFLQIFLNPSLQSAINGDLKRDQKFHVGEATITKMYNELEVTPVNNKLSTWENHLVKIDFNLNEEIIKSNLIQNTIIQTPQTYLKDPFKILFDQQFLSLFLHFWKTKVPGLSKNEQLQITKQKQYERSKTQKNLMHQLDLLLRKEFKKMIIKKKIQPKLLSAHKKNIIKKARIESNSWKLSQEQFFEKFLSQFINFTSSDVNSEKNKTLEK
ncbi:l-seryl-tRNA(sec) kinase [Anaeramoeba flamelloides]|uniref:L-seryl-tRNA(Sec) kinase n=1 Tax=Anaeramoeba flamelloides TaxID=1746091 RepID=A0AAV7ZL42_9EUKA|nr:l-seryl-tRNA(sec) kinase [Anaeramoeba flamelloides]